MDGSLPMVSQPVPGIGITENVSAVLAASENRSKRAAELEEIRKQRLAKTWKDTNPDSAPPPEPSPSASPRPTSSEHFRLMRVTGLPTAAGNVAPGAMDEWHSQQHDKRREHKQLRQDAVQNLHNFRLKDWGGKNSPTPSDSNDAQNNQLPDTPSLTDADTTIQNQNHTAEPSPTLSQNGVEVVLSKEDWVVVDHKSSQQNTMTADTSVMFGAGDAAAGGSAAPSVPILDTDNTPQNVSRNLPHQPPMSLVPPRQPSMGVVSDAETSAGIGTTPMEVIFTFGLILPTEAPVDSDSLSPYMELTAQIILSLDLSTFRLQTMPDIRRVEQDFNYTPSPNRPNVVRYTVQAAVPLTLITCSPEEARYHVLSALRAALAQGRFR